MFKKKRFPGRAVVFFVSVLTIPAAAQTVRVATYNIDADTGNTVPNSSLYQVLEGIGEEKVNNVLRPLDILALQETTSNTTTVDPIVTNLNSYYQGSGIASYARSSYQATESNNNPTSGNGPNALVYNTKTLNLIASVGVGTPQGATNGEYRQVVRYEFQPVGATGLNGIFYVYDSHYKSGTTSADLTDRNGEAQIIRNNEAANLPATARVLYTGDFNISSSGEASFQTIAAVNSPNSVAQGQGFDPFNPTAQSINYDTNATYANQLTESAKDLRYRDDLQMMTGNVYNATSGGLGYVTNSLHTFGNNGTVAIYGAATDSGNTALNGTLFTDGGTFVDAPMIRTALTNATDHYPVVADYTDAVPEPTALAGLALFPLLFRRCRR